MVDDISKLYEKILEEQNKNEIVAPIQKKHLIEENESQIGDSNEEPFDNFLLKLGETIAEHLDLPQDVINDSGNSYGGVPLEKQTTKSSYIEELKKMDKGDKSKLLPKENNISATISEQVREEIGKVKTQISRMAIEGGGGSVAVQYAKGGTMNGDLNVTGKYLSGGIDLATLIGTGGGGGLSGTTDRLISGSEMVKLNPDGTINFPNNTITPQDETILTLEATKVLDNYYNRLALSPYGFFASDHNGNSITINSVDNEILIDSNDTYYWKFNNQGALEGPFGTLSVSGNLSATGRVYQNGNDLQSEIESISAISISTKTTVQSNSASWDYQGTDLKNLSAGWVGGNSAYTTVNANSASWATDSTTDTGVRSLTSNWENTYSTVQSNSADWSNHVDTGVRALTGNWSSSYTTVNSNSASWDYQGSDIKSLTGGWVGGNDAYTNLVANSAAYLSGADLSFLSVSANWNSVYSSVTNTSANWDSTYSTVQSNSASWATDSTTDTGVRSLTSNWENTYTTVASNSSDWSNHVDVGVRSLTGNWDSTYSTVQANSASWATDSTIDSGVRSLTANWESTYTTVGSNSGDWNYQGSDIKALTGNWQDAYTNLVSNSAAYLSSVDLSFLSVSTNWDSVYTTVLNESASWVGGGTIVGEYLPLSGGTMTGPISFGSLYGSKIDQGIYDSARSGLSGISLVCSVNYDFNWQAGWITSLEQDRLTPMPLYIDSGAGTSLRVWDGAYVGDVAGTGIEISHTQITFADNSSQTTAFTGNTLTFNESTKDLTISNGNTVSLSALVDASGIDTGVRLLTSNWESTFTTVLNNSANWDTSYTIIQANSATWNAADEVLVAQVTNADSVTLNRGDVVYSFGATGSVMSVKLASNSAESTSSKTLGIINETIIPNGIGYATVAGRMDKMVFPHPFVDGDALWLGSTAGTFTRVKPTSPNHLVYLGVVERANNGNGLAYIKVQNGYELDELHDVSISNTQAKDLLQRNSTNTLWVNGQLSADGSNITSGTINAARMPTFNGDITATTGNGSVSAKVVAIQGNPISNQVPTNGNILQWNGTSWTPGSVPTGGSGGGGLFYFFNQALSAQAPTTNLPVTAHQLGRFGSAAQTLFTSPILSTSTYTLIAGFVTDVLDPNTNVILGGLWDFNIWGYSNANTSTPTVMQALVYKYDGVNAPVLLSTSDDTTLTDSGLYIQHQMTCLVPQTSASLTDRIYVEFRAKASASNKNVFLAFGDSTPSHIHTTLPSVGGSGLMKVIDGVVQSPASLLFDSDVASSANIAQSKINGLTDTTSKTNSTYTTVNSNSADWESTYTTVNSNSATTWNYQGTDLKNLSANWQNTFTTVQANSAAWSTVTSYSTLIGDNTTNPLTAVHNLNTKDIIFSVREVATNKLIQAAGRTVDNNSLELTFNTTPTINQYYLTVLCNGGIAGTSSGTTNTFALTTITSSTYIQNVSYTHNLYSDSIASGQILVYLLPPANHVAVTQHKKIGSTASVVLSAPNGATIDGQPTYTLNNQYEAIGLYTDGSNYFIQ